MNATKMGAYRYYAKETGESFVGFSRNLTGTHKRLRFELKLNACSYQPLQAFYNAHAGEVEFDILEEYDPDPSLCEEEIDAHLMALVLRYQAQLKARLIQVRV